MNKIYIILMAVVSIVIVMITLPVLSSQVDDLTGYETVKVDYLSSEIITSDPNHYFFYTFYGINDPDTYEGMIDFEELKIRQNAYLYIPWNENLITQSSTSHTVQMVSKKVGETYEIDEFEFRTATNSPTGAYDDWFLYQYPDAGTLIRVNLYELIIHLIDNSAVYTSYDDLFNNLQWIYFNVELNVGDDISVYDYDYWENFFTTELRLDTDYSNIDTTYSVTGSQIVFEGGAVYEGTTTGVLINILPMIIVTGILVTTIGLIYFKKRG